MHGCASEFTFKLVRVFGVQSTSFQLHTLQHTDPKSGRGWVKRLHDKRPNCRTMFLFLIDAAPFALHSSSRAIAQQNGRYQRPIGF